MDYIMPISHLKGEDNMGGVVSLQLASKTDIAFVPEPINGVVYGDIIFNAGAGWTEWKFTQQSGGIKSASRSSREGPTKSNSFPFKIPKDRPALRQMLAQAEHDEFIVMFKYANGKRKIFGLPDAPVRFEFDHDSGSNFADGNFYSARFYFDGPDNIYFYEGAIATAPPGAAPAIVKVNGVVVASLQPGETADFDTPFSFDLQIIGT